MMSPGVLMGVATVAMMLVAVYEALTAVSTASGSRSGSSPGRSRDVAAFGAAIFGHRSVLGSVVLAVMAASRQILLDGVVTMRSSSVATMTRSARLHLGTLIDPLDHAGFPARGTNASQVGGWNRIVRE